MGCWNETCGVSQVAITAGERIAVVLIQEQKHVEAEGHSYSTELWTPAFLPIFGKYDDYGGIEEIEEDWNTLFILDYIRKNFLDKSDNVFVLTEQLEAVDVSTFQYRVVFRPQALIPDVDFQGDANELVSPSNKDG
jgi:hypothetical protein